MYIQCIVHVYLSSRHCNFSFLFCVDRCSTPLTFCVKWYMYYLSCCIRVLLLWCIDINTFSILMFILLGIGIYSVRV